MASNNEILTSLSALPDIEANLNSEQYSIEDLTTVMKKTGFAPSIIKGYRDAVREMREFEKNHDRNFEQNSDSAVNILCKQYDEVNFSLKFITDDNAREMVPYQVHDTLANEAREIVFDDERGEEYYSRIATDFNELQSRMHETLSDAVDYESSFGNDVTKEEFDEIKKYINESKRRASLFEASLHARFGYWLADSMLNVFVTNPEQQPAVKALAYKKRKNILSDHAPVKIAAGEELLKIVNEIDGVEYDEIYRDGFNFLIKYILNSYEKTNEKLQLIKNYEIKARIIEEKLPEDLEPTGVLEIQNDIAEDTQYEDVSQVENISTTPPSPSKSPKEPKSIPPKNTYSPKLLQEWQQQQEKEAAELAELQKELDRIEAEEAAAKLVEEEREVEDTVTKLYRKGETVNFSDIGNKNESEFDSNDDTEIERKQKELIRSQRKLEIKEAAECFDVDKLVILKAMSKRAEAETYMAVIESEDNNEDVIVLNNDSYGSAVYIGLRKDMNSAIELAEIRQKKNQKANDDDILFYMMRNCRTEMRECGLSPITHNKADVAVDIAMAIEEIRPPQCELKINRD